MNKLILLVILFSVKALASDFNLIVSFNKPVKKALLVMQYKSTNYIGCSAFGEIVRENVKLNAENTLDIWIKELPKTYCRAKLDTVKLFLDIEGLEPVYRFEPFKWSNMTIHYRADESYFSQPEQLVYTNVSCQKSATHATIAKQCFINEIQQNVATGAILAMLNSNGTTETHVIIEE